MPNPKNFSPENALNESYIIDPMNPANVIVFRFGDRGEDRDWLSRKRQASNGNYVRPNNSTLNDWAIKQSSYGSQAENIDDNPFLSVVTSYSELFENGEVWVQGILHKVPNLGKFSVPFDRVFRPSPTKLISKSETEWLYYDGDAPLLSCLVEWRDNPYHI